MEKMVDALQMAKQVAQNMDDQTAKTQLTYILGAGIICMLVMGLTFFMQMRLQAMKSTPKPYAKNTQNSDSPNISDKLSSELLANNAVKQYYELQLEELAKYQFTNTEQQIATLILHGETNRSIAERIHIAESTVKKYVQRILSKTGATNRKEFSQLIQSSIEHKFI